LKCAGDVSPVSGMSTGVDEQRGHTVHVVHVWKYWQAKGHSSYTGWIPTLCRAYTPGRPSYTLNTENLRTCLSYWHNNARAYRPTVLPIECADLTN
jgi:hypothetical protein